MAIIRSYTADYGIVKYGGNNIRLFRRNDTFTCASIASQDTIGESGLPLSRDITSLKFCSTAVTFGTSMLRQKPYKLSGCGCSKSRRCYSHQLLLLICRKFWRIGERPSRPLSNLLGGACCWLASIYAPRFFEMQRDVDQWK